MLNAVAKVVSTAQPPVEYTCNKYREAHEAVVSSPVYNRALDLADGIVRRVQVSHHASCPAALLSVLTRSFIVHHHRSKPLNVHCRTPLCIRLQLTVSTQ